MHRVLLSSLKKEKKGKTPTEGRFVPLLQVPLLSFLFSLSLTFLIYDRKTVGSFFCGKYSEQMFV